MRHTAPAQTHKNTKTHTLTHTHALPTRRFWMQLVSLASGVGALVALFFIAPVNALN